MSASEKLRALDAEFTPRTTWRQIDYDLARALPQIVAVVEAAEQLPEFFHVDGQAHSFVPLLDALDEQLGDLGSPSGTEPPTAQ